MKPAAAALGRSSEAPQMFRVRISGPGAEAVEPLVAHYHSFSAAGRPQPGLLRPRRYTADETPPHATVSLPQLAGRTADAAPWVVRVIGVASSLLAGVVAGCALLPQMPLLLPRA
ncbi:MAG: hypothetical protein NZ699_18150 [Roseiflexus sp.]|nr:hypothetical protein [Roseiflexus sp.]MCS7291048.1 hypothetical protein [Roseiflexus sp.]MDW8146764.1 hypothetical protein [Roseiflexaceae bacterium]MDW8234489.1 hypothetical protein [Roseiflexaceae bacterium]